MIVDQALYIDGVRRPCGDVGAELTHLSEPGASEGSRYLWIGLKDPTDAEFATMREQLHLHPLAVEDAVVGRQRPKIDFYEESIFVNLKTLRYLEETSDVETGELQIFIGSHFVLTVRTGEANPLAGIRAGLEHNPARAALGPQAVLHAVIDHIVDTYVEVDLELGRDLEEIEERVFAGSTDVRGSEIYKLKREVLEFKRASLPLVVPLRRIVSGDHRRAFDKRLRPFFADVLDHLLQVADHVESYDHLLSDILAAHLSQVSVRQNEDMRKISAWVAIAAVPTMIAGVYGMNFDWMPELTWHYGYFYALGLMLTACAGLFAQFKRVGWL
ncbi:magnesium/cobalt transporter CorA [Agilicoccus flavus]|uniref:magnesium/cobalt transporter CorA n=1 Tax=Agilicoccus flavus TaxID=2775968 RepID=UPI001CF61692|nr:magnesium/cobalt transporter CorA [Agilicoccus flavus]